MNANTKSCLDWPYFARKGLSYALTPAGAFVLALTNRTGKNAPTPMKAAAPRPHPSPLVSASLRANAAIEHKTVMAKDKVAYIIRALGQAGCHRLCLTPPPWYHSYEMHAGANCAAGEASHWSANRSSRETVLCPTTCHLGKVR